MATFEQVMNQRMAKIQKIIDKGLKTVLGEEIRETILYYLENNFYSMGYGNRGDLAKSISVDVEMVNNNAFLINVYFDDDKICHRSWFGSESLGISQGDRVYSVSWINDGKTFIKGSTSVRLEDIGVKPHFMEDALSDLQRNSGWVEKFYNYLRSNGIDIEN
ncbi:MAG: hypothetical protein ACRDD7_03530 [Peptostreptococcaceae bacterium]